MIAAIESGAIRPVFLYEGEFAGGTVRLFTGYGTLTWNGHDWTGDSGLMRISNVQEVSELQAVNFTVSLNGQVSALSAIALAQINHLRLDKNPDLKSAANNLAQIGRAHV